MVVANVASLVELQRKNMAFDNTAKISSLTKEWPHLAKFSNVIQTLMAKEIWKVDEMIVSGRQPYIFEEGDLRCECIFNCR